MAKQYVALITEQSNVFLRFHLFNYLEPVEFLQGNDNVLVRLQELP